MKIFVLKRVKDQYTGHMADLPVKHFGSDATAALDWLARQMATGRYKLGSASHFTQDDVDRNIRKNCMK